MVETVLARRVGEQFGDDQTWYDRRFAEITSVPETLTCADTIIDRLAIEVQANELISCRSVIESNYKTESTYINDARTLLFEALTASGHLSVVETTGTLEEIHSTMLCVLLNSYSESLPEHEKRRRFQEICEELTIQVFEQKVAQNEIPQTYEVATISDYIPDNALSETQAKSIGYRPYNAKGMVRSSRLRVNADGTYTRVSEQVSRSNAQATRTQSFLEDCGINVRVANHADISVLGTQLIHEMSEGVVGLVRRLDAHQGQDIRYGEAAVSSQITYKELRNVSEERERVAHCYVEKLAAFTRRLDQLKTNGDISEQQYQQQFKHEIKNILRAICVMDPSYAIDCFGKESAAGFTEASNLVAAGDYSGATRVLENNKQREQTVTFCGMSLDAEEAKKMGVDGDSLTELLKFGKEKWGKEKHGRCRIENCPSPKVTKLGGCGICIGGCQRLFDRGWKYEKIIQHYARLRRAAKKTGATATKGVQNLKTLLFGYEQSK